MRFYGIAFVFIFCFTSALQVQAQTMSYTLGQLVIESEQIVIGKGVSQKTVDGSAVIPVDQINLLVQSRLKGPEISELLVSTQSHGPGEKPLFSFRSPILYFLQPSSDPDLLQVSGNRSGSRVVSPFGLVRYSVLIQKLLTIEEMEDGEAKTKALVEWNVKCVEGQYGRTDGMIELLGKGYFFSQPGIDVNALLTDAQRKRLFDVLISLEELDYLHLEMIPLIRGVDDIALQKHLIKKMENPEDLSPRFALTLMNEMNELNGSEKCKGITKQYEDINWNDPDRKEKRRTYIKAYYAEVQVLLADPVEE